VGFSPDRKGAQKVSGAVFPMPSEGSVEFLNETCWRGWGIDERNSVLIFHL
jgi:hypothetical protein